MAEDTSNSIDFFLGISKSYLEDLSVIRQWTNLKVAFDKDDVWITGFNSVQIESVEVKSIPFKEVFYSKGNKLYILNSLLPDRNKPSFLWTPIQRALPVKIEKYNHNYFGLKQTGVVKIVKDQEIKEAKVMRTTLESLINYVETAPFFRLENIQWVVLNNKDVLLFGSPVLPIDGDMFWLTNDSIMPVGYNFELSVLAELIGNKINSEKKSWVVWNADSSYFKVTKHLIEPLSLSSVRKTLLITKL